jgi:agmatinase
LKALFEMLAGPAARSCAPAVWFGRYRTVAFDGCRLVEVPDTPRNRGWLGKLNALLERALHLLTLGGDHTVALPLLRAMAEVHGPVAVVHFDAHLDTWDTFFGSAYTHGTPFRRASEEGLLDRSGSLHVGIRGSVYSDTDLDQDTGLGFQVVSAPEIDQIGVSEVVERIKQRVGERPVYVSVGIDVLDPGLPPGTGPPEDGGLTSRELLTMLRAFAGLNLLGADIVEVSPAYDHAQVTGIAAVHASYELLAALAARKAVS